MNFWDLSPERMRALVETNLIGVMYGCKIAIQGMLTQGFGFIYNMEGYGSDGRNMVKGLALYGSTKAALRFLTDQLMREVEGTPVRVGALRPGMVITDMITSQYQERPAEWQRARRIFNILADRVETVTPWLARKILENERNGARIRYTSGRKILWRFITAPFSKRNVFDS